MNLVKEFLSSITIHKVNLNVNFGLKMVLLISKNQFFGNLQYKGHIETKYSY